MTPEQIIKQIESHLQEAKQYYTEDIEEQDFYGEELCDAYYNNGYYEALEELLMKVKSK